jgi:hypothetical protein
MTILRYAAPLLILTVLAVACSPAKSGDNRTGDGIPVNAVAPPPGPAN